MYATYTRAVELCKLQDFPYRYKSSKSTGKLIVLTDASVVRKKNP